MGGRSKLLAALISNAKIDGGYAVMDTFWKWFTTSPGVVSTTLPMEDHGLAQQVDVRFGGDGDYAASDTSAILRWGTAGPIH